jgi:hypothetical protein
MIFQLQQIYPTVIQFDHITNLLHNYKSPNYFSIYVNFRSKINKKEDGDNEKDNERGWDKDSEEG